MTTTISVSKFQELEKEAREIVSKVSNDPEARYNLRVEFYQRHGKYAHHGFGNSELAFLRWEITRGVLNPVDGDGPVKGSPWWRAVNSEFIYYSELAGLIYENDPTATDISVPVDAWLNYLRHPSSQLWYRAHNASIVTGYLNNIDLAKKEDLPEQFFLNEVLFRVIFAQALVEGTELAYRIIANPRLPCVNVLVHLPDFYPIHYPLTKKDIAAIMHDGYSLEEFAEDVLDEVFILPHVKDLYCQAAGWLNIKELETFCKENQPVYPGLDTPPLVMEPHILVKFMGRILTVLVKIFNIRMFFIRKNYKIQSIKINESGRFFRR